MHHPESPEGDAQNLHELLLRRPLLLLNNVLLMCLGVGDAAVRRRLVCVPPHSNFVVAHGVLHFFAHVHAAIDRAHPNDGAEASEAIDLLICLKLVQPPSHVPPLELSTRRRSRGNLENPQKTDNH